MIVLDPHIWVWWIHGDANLADSHRQLIEANETSGIGISSISLWEVSKLVERKRLILPKSLETWMAEALSYPGMALLELSPQIAVESTQLPGRFHDDPADQIIVATARVHSCPLVTADRRIRDYAHVDTPT